MGTIVAKTYGRIRCVFCGSLSSHLHMYSTRYEPEFGGSYRLYFDRRYVCHNCQAEISITTLECDHDINNLLEKDRIWAEKQSYE